MQNNRFFFRPWLSYVLILLVLGIVISYHYEWLYGGYYPGFFYNPNGGEVYEIFVSKDISELQIGDKITHINSVSMESYNNNPFLKIWTGMEPGDTFSVQAIRDEHPIEITWTYLGFSNEDFLSRLYSQWWLAYIFWFAGLASYLIIRPRDNLWRALVSFNLTTALWFAAGSGPSAFHILGSAMVLRIGVWVTVPILIHLHWVFPRRFERISKRLESVILRSAYVLSLGFIILSLIFPEISSTYQYGFLLSLLISGVFLIFHYVFQKGARDQIKLIFRITLLAYIPIILTMVLSFFTEIPSFTWGACMVGLSVIPISYFVAISRGRLGNHEFRANRAISIYLFLLFLMAILLLTFTIIENRTGESDPFALTTLITVFSTAILTIYFFPIFQRFIETKILGIPLPQKDLLQTYAAQITTSLNPESISSLLSSLILPSIMVRQSALITIHDHEVNRIYQDGIQENQLPTLEQIPDMLKLESRYILPDEIGQFPKYLDWIRVILPLSFDKNLIGLWLLGQRDPNDMYEASLIEILQALAHQTSMALINQRQTQRLRDLYKVNIDRHETERTRLARELHDETLNNLALLQLETKDPEISRDIEDMIADLRETIHGLRPEMLTYGLLTALQDLGDTLNERQSETTIQADLEGELVQIDSNVELHLFRVVQQACENTLRHAQAKNLRITGEIASSNINILVSDNGIGFEIKPKMLLSNLLAEKHYGLAGMHERVDLIGGRIDIQSTIGNGTDIFITWPDS